MPVTISGDGGITGLQLESFEDVDVGSGASDGDVLTYDATGDLWIPQGVALSAGIGSNVVQTVKTDTFTTTSTSFVSVTGLSATITPTSVSSKILIILAASIGRGGGDGTSSFIRISGGNTSGFIGDAASSRTRAAATTGERRNNYGTEWGQWVATVVAVDSPATTSPVTYEAQAASNATFTLNRSGDDRNSPSATRTISTITLIEVAA